MTAPDFTAAGYRALVRALRGRGYRPAWFDDDPLDGRRLLLRHDIDQSIQAARALAEIEAEDGVAATYFVLVRTEMYNPLSRASAADLGRILALGHRIGLHLDAALYDDDDRAIDRAAAQECAVLEQMLGVAVGAISFHRPAKRLLGLDRDFAGRAHAYQPRTFSRIGYCSDSRGAWRHGAPLRHPAVAEGRALQLLTHPIWWLAESPTPPRAALEALLDSRAGVLRQELWDNCEAFRDQPGGARRR